MADNSGIEWTDATWNPHTGCTRVSPGCDNCYMFREYPRLRSMLVSGYEIDPSVVQFMPARLAQPWQWKRPRRIFVNSMSDLFHHAIPYETITQVFTVMAYRAPWHTYQVLTKRPGRAVGWWEQEGRDQFEEWPANVWIGTSVENQKYAPRLTVLARIPAPIRFVSAEPLLGPLNIEHWLELDRLQWVICGGESGPGARPMDESWARNLLIQCQEAHVPFFLKQLGGGRDKRAGTKAILDGQEWKAFPAKPEIPF